MVSDRAIIFHIIIYIPWGKTLFLVKVICQGQGQISRSTHRVIEKMAISGALVFQKHSLFISHHKHF